MAEYKEYKCSFCQQSMVKLWHPEGNSSPLICAKCAEARQSVRICNEYVWSRDGKRAKKTGNKSICKRWEVDDEGQIPSPVCLSQNSSPIGKITDLLVDFDGVATKMVPATEGVAWRMLPTNPRQS